MKKLNPKDIIKPTLTLFIICVVIAGLLAGTNTLTKVPIEQQTQLKAQQARQIVAPDAVSFKNQQTDTPDADCYAALSSDGVLIGYTVTASKKGYGGDVKVMVGFNSVLRTITGVAILSQSETPGLGANAVKPDFTDQFKQTVPDNGFSVIKSAEPKEGEIAAMTGATITSSAVAGAVNDAINVYNQLVGPDQKIQSDDLKTAAGLYEMCFGEGGGN